MAFTIAADTVRLEPGSGRKKLENKVALLTGGAKGMGGTIAELFAREGASLVLAARDLDALDAELKRIRNVAPDVRGIPVRCDVTDQGQVREMVRRALDQVGQ